MRHGILEPLTDPLKSVILSEVCRILCAKRSRRTRFLFSHPQPPSATLQTSRSWLNGQDYVTDRFNDQGKPLPHDKRSKIRIDGSMNTTIADFSKFAAARARSDGLTPASRAEITCPVMHITTATQFPLFRPDLPPARQRKDLLRRPRRHPLHRPSGPRLLQRRPRQPDRQHHGLHRVQPALRPHPLERCPRRKGLPPLVRFLLGDTGVPYDWEYGNQAGKS